MSISDEKREAYMKWFDMMDKSGDGVINVTELVEGLKANFTGGDHQKAIDVACDLQQQCDTDGDGKISRDEFLAALSQ